MAISITACTDCDRVMPWFRDNEFSLGSYDPPYFDGPQKLGYYGGYYSPLGIKRTNYKHDFWEPPTAEWWIEAQRISVEQILWGANYFDFMGEPFATPRREFLQDFLDKYPRGWIVWDKCNGKSSFNDYELAWTSFDMPTTIYRYMWNGMMQGKGIDDGHIMQGNKKLNEKRIHMTQKPVMLYGWQFREFVPEGGSIFEGYLGSGSARVAAYKMGIDFYGVEKDKNVFQLQEKRFEKEKYNLFT